MNEDAISDAYRRRLIDGIYSRNISKKDLLYAEIHQQLDPVTATDPDKLEQLIRELALTNQTIFLLDNMFGTQPEKKEEDCCDSNQESD